MKRMTLSEIRSSWIKFFEARGHYFLPPVSLIPKNDDSLLWINSGVATLKDYFSGKKNPPASRLVNSQDAIRTNDFFNVGLTSRHQTLFEMLGNFSIGDYFKKEAIGFAFELLTKEWEIDLDRLWFTIFEDDEVAFATWTAHGVSPDRILRCGRDRNFWDLGNGPCGPCTEIYYDRGERYDFDHLGERLIREDLENDRYVEIWNIVFSEFNNDGNGNYTELTRKNIDTGAGLERLASVSQDVPTNFDVDVFQEIIHTLEGHSHKHYDVDNYFRRDPAQTKINFAYKVMADHFRAAVFAIADGAVLSNKGRGYVLRRLIRRALVFAHQLGMEGNAYIRDVIDAVVRVMGDFYTHLSEHKEQVFVAINNENELFKKTLSRGLELFHDSIKHGELSDQVVFDLVTTYGFPIELIKEIAANEGISVDTDAFAVKFKEHQKISRVNQQGRAIDQQNPELMKLTVPSEFKYETFALDSKVVKLYDEAFHPVEHLEGDGYAVFAETPFYATSGGQISDMGYVNNFFINDVQKGPNKQHIHHVVGANLRVGETVHLQINAFDRERITRNHSVEHLLHASLKRNVDQNVKQEGAFKSPDKVTFDFQYQQKLSDHQLQQIEDWVNQKIREQHAVDVKKMDLEEAQKMGALAYFTDVYRKIDGKLRVIDMGADVSRELCGGTHVHNTGDIEKFQIIDYYSKGSGSWRIEATAGEYNIEQAKEQALKKFDEIVPLDEEFEQQLAHLPLWKWKEEFQKYQERVQQKKRVEEMAEVENQERLIREKLPHTAKSALLVSADVNTEAIKVALKNAVNHDPEAVFVIFRQVEDQKWSFFAATNNAHYPLNETLVPAISKRFVARGGGKANYCQGGINEAVSSDVLTIFLGQLGYTVA